MFTNDARRLKQIVEKADEMGDGPAALGVMMLMAMSDEEFANFIDPDFPESEIIPILHKHENFFADLGIVLS